jgi:predicted ArsR family transcriptional regulator
MTAAASIPPTTRTGFIVISSVSIYTTNGGEIGRVQHRGRSGIAVRGFADAARFVGFDTHSVNGKTLHHRALADPSRVRLLECLRASERPLSVDELAGKVGLHQNTIRAHLAVLEETELVVARSERDGRPGRPRRLYAAVPEEAEEEHALLASALASSLEPLPDGTDIATAAGRSWGAVLVERLEPGRPSDEAACVERVASLLRRRGFAPERERSDLVMHRCPFRELAERYPRVVCGFHAGLIDGALTELGAPVRLGTLEPWVSPTSCVARLEPSTPEGD